MWLRRAVGLVQGEGRVCLCTWPFLRMSFRMSRFKEEAPKAVSSRTTVHAGSVVSRSGVCTRRRACRTLQLSPGGSRPLSGWEKNTGFLSPLGTGTVGGVASPISQLNSSFLLCTHLDVEKQNELYKVSHVCLGVLWLSAGVLIKNLCVRFNNLR